MGTREAKSLQGRLGAIDRGIEAVLQCCAVLWGCLGCDIGTRARVAGARERALTGSCLGSKGPAQMHKDVTHTGFIPAPLLHARV